MVVVEIVVAVTAADVFFILNIKATLNNACSTALTQHSINICLPPAADRPVPNFMKLLRPYLWL